jgi:hypothetical protein
MASSIPATLDALLALWRAALPSVMFVDVLTLSGDDGRTAADNIARRVIVGGDPENAADLDFDREWAGLGALRMDESYDIPCHLECVSGDEDATALRDAAIDLFDSLSAALAADNTLGGLVQQGAAVLGRGSMRSEQRETGASVQIRFQVHCETRVNQ